MMTELQNLPLRDLLTLAALKGQSGKDHLFDKRALNGQIRADDNALVENVRKGLDQSSPLSEGEIKEAIRLVKTGHLADDVNAALKETLSTVAEVPADLLKNPLALFKSPLNTIALPGNAARQAAKIFVDPDKRTLRLAILAYARLHGIHVNESNLNDVYNLLDQPDAENLENLARGGLETIKAEYGLNDLSEALHQYRLLTGRNS